MSEPTADLLAAECEHLSAVVEGLSEEEFALPTRCPPWDVKALLAHVWRDMDRIPAHLAEPEPDAPDADAVSYWRSYDPVAEGPLISAHAYEVGDRFATGSLLARSFAEHWRECLEAARGRDPGRLLRTRIAAIRLDDFLGTRVLELTVHGLDMARALGREPWITPGGLSLTREILVGLLAGEPPSAVGWDDVTFIETGTGRRPLSQAESAVLGSAAERFPLLR